MLQSASCAPQVGQDLVYERGEIADLSHEQTPLNEALLTFYQKLQAVATQAGLQLVY